MWVAVDADARAGEVAGHAAMQALLAAVLEDEDEGAEEDQREGGTESDGVHAATAFGSGSA